MKLVAGSYEQTVLAYEITSNDDGTLSYEQGFCEHSHDGFVKCLASGKLYVASSASDSTICLYDLSKNEEIATFQADMGSVNCILLPDDAHLISAGEDGILRVWETKYQGRLLFSFIGNQGPISSIALHPSGKMCLSVNTENGSVFTWDMISGRKAYVKNFKWLKPELVRWSSDGKHFVLASPKCINVYELKTAKCVQVIELTTAIQSLEFVPKASEDARNCIVTGDNDGYVQVLDLLTGQSLSRFMAHDKRVKGVTLLDSKEITEGEHVCIATVSSDEHLKVWKLERDTLMSSTKETDMNCPAKCLLDIVTGARLTCVTSWSPPPPPTTTEQETITEE